MFHNDGWHPTSAEWAVIGVCAVFLVWALTGRNLDLAAGTIIFAGAVISIAELRRGNRKHRAARSGAK